MKPSTWRALVLTMCAVTVILTGANAIDYFGFAGKAAWSGNPGMNLGTSEAPYRAAILAVDPGGAAARAGLHSGDRFDVRANALVERWQLLSGNAIFGHPITLLLQRGSQQSEVAIAPRPWDGRFWFFLFWYCGILLLALFAALIAWRRAETPGNLLLSTILAFVAIGSISGPGDYALPWASAYVALAIVQTAYFVSIALWVAYAGRFAEPLSRPRRVTQWICQGCVAIAIIVNVATIIGIVTLWFDPLRFMFSPYWKIPLDAAVIMAVLCSVLAITASRGVERQRATWTLVAFSIFFASLQAAHAVLQTSASYTEYVGISAFANLSFILMPIVLVYVALNRRLIDIGFVLNRAAVFAIVSVIVVGAFVLVEWAASAWLTDATRTTSAVAGMIVALTLGLSLRYVHKYVDRFVDRVFFRKRHEDEAALRRFAHEASYISDRSTLLQRAVRMIKEHTTADDAVILARRGASAFVADGQGAEVSQDDPGIVALRAWHKPLDLNEITDSVLSGEIAFPMVARGELVGALICGPKRDGEAYAPDESDALLTLARGVGIALDTLALRNGDAVVSMQEQLALIVEKLDALALKPNEGP
jgi:hypothetical protein